MATWTGQQYSAVRGVVQRSANVWASGLTWEELAVKAAAKGEGV